jgi:hypothetical protein
MGLFPYQLCDAMRAMMTDALLLGCSRVVFKYPEASRHGVISSHFQRFS